MNVLYLHCHDAGRYLGLFGQPVPTPHLSRLAERATLFRQAFCAAPTCSPSRAALLTGMHPHETGMIGLAHRGFHLSRPERHLARYLRDHGFHTALSGIQHEFEGAPTSTYEEIFESSGPKGAAYDQASAEWAARWLSQKRDRPFFLSCGFFLPHREFPTTTKPSGHLAPPPGVPDCPQTRADTARYLEAVRIMDECCGTVLDALAGGPNAEDTIIIFTTDHGPPFPYMKCNLTDAGLGVALLFDHPGNALRGGVVDAAVSHLDIYPTLCELLGLPAPDWLRGRSLVPLLRGESAVLHEVLYGEVTYHAAYEPMRSIRTDRYKLIEYFGEDTRRMPSNVDPSPAKDLLAQAGLFDVPRERLQLFDLILDPGETKQLADQPACRAILEDLRRRLHHWMQETGDPLRLGPVAQPEGTTVNPR